MKRKKDSPDRDRASGAVRYIPVDLPEPELRWRRQQVVRVLAEILRGTDAAPGKANP